MKEITVDDLARMIAKGFSALDERFERLEVRLDNLEARMDKLETRMSKLEKVVDKIVIQMSRSDRRLNILENHVFALKSA